MDPTILESDQPSETWRGRHRPGRHRAERDEFADTSKRWNRTLALMVTVLMVFCGGLATTGFLLFRR